MMMGSPAYAGDLTDSVNGPAPVSHPNDLSARLVTDGQSDHEAWWTGSLLSTNADALPQGHFVVEPFLYDSKPYAHFDNNGHATSIHGQDDFGLLTYINYGLTNRLTIGAIARFGYNRVDGGNSSSAIRSGDTTLQAQYQFTQFRAGSALPSLSISVQETLPTGQFDRLVHDGDGIGSGGNTTTFSLLSQNILKMPGGQSMRVRLNLSYAVAGTTGVHGASVFGTPDSFSGIARRGNSAFVDLGIEMTVSRRWVMALDLWYERDNKTRVTGEATIPNSSTAAYITETGPSRLLLVAPAIEYNWSSRFGMIVGAQIIVAGRNQTATFTPVIGVNRFF